MCRCDRRVAARYGRRGARRPRRGRRSLERAAARQAAQAALTHACLFPAQAYVKAQGGLVKGKVG